MWGGKWLLATQRLPVIINCEWKAKGDRVYFLNTLLCHSRAAPELPALWHASPRGSDQWQPGFWNVYLHFIDSHWSKDADRWGNRYECKPEVTLCYISFAKEHKYHHKVNSGGGFAKFFSQRGIKFPPEDREQSAAGKPEGCVWRRWRTNGGKILVRLNMAFKSEDIFLGVVCVVWFTMFMKLDNGILTEKRNIYMKVKDRIFLGYTKYIYVNSFYHGYV